jgi:hypothetical protein
MAWNRPRIRFNPLLGMTEALIITGLFYLFFFLLGAIVLGSLIHRLSATQVPVLSCFTSGAIFLLPVNLLILHYLLWLCPHHPPRFYAGMLIICNACLYLTGAKKMKHFFLLVVTEMRFRIGHTLTMFLPVGFVLMVYAGIFLSASKPFVEHDAMEYAVYGNSMAQKAEIVYVKHHYDQESGFYYYGLHGYAFPLLRTLECFINGWLPTGDFIFRSLNALCGFLLVLLAGVAALSFSGRFASWLMLCLLMSYVFIFSFFQVSVDHFRMMQLFAFALLWYQSRNFKHTHSWYLLLCFLAGLAAFSHALNMLLLSVFLALEFYFLFRLHIKPVAISILGFSLGGALHYFLETFIGTGWIFQ